MTKTVLPVATFALGGGSSACSRWALVTFTSLNNHSFDSNMKTITRRTCLKQIALAVVANTLPVIFRPRSVFALDTEQPLPTEREISALSGIARQFMDRFKVPGLSMAIARHGQFVYKEGFGFADAAKRENMTASHLFRIASVTKPITSAAIFSLIEQGKFGLDDVVFGQRGLLQFDYGRTYPGRLKEITVHHLLTHTCGGWEKGANDPMFSNPAMDHKHLIEWTLRGRPLSHAPGTHYDYSNFGYCLLGRILEKISGQSYAEFVQQTILAKCGITKMQLAENTLAERAQGEVLYYGQNGENPYNMNIRRMDSHGGWIATPSDLVQFAMHVDGFNITPNILRAETIKTMTTPSTANPSYACGWAVSKVPNWWHVGSLPGTTTILVRTASGLYWAAFANTRANGIDLAIDELMWKMVKAVPAWQV
jgi:CubicO group peptidase (beta-lactamase class C family)